MDPQMKAEAVAEALTGVVIEHGLRRAEAATDTHVITVAEPGLWDRDTDLQTTIKEIDY